MGTLSLASVTTGDAIKPPRIIIYGGDGVGKTTFAANAPSPIFIRSEDGLGVLKVAAFPPANAYVDVLEAMRVLIREKHTYRTLVIDSLDWLESMIWTGVCQERNVKSIEDIGFGKGYVMADDYWAEFFKACDIIRDRLNMTIILICHSEIKRFDDPMSEPYDRHQLKLHKRANAKATEWADIVAFAQHETVVRESDVGFNKKVARGISTGNRILQLTETPAYDAKNRYGLPDSLPLDYAVFREALKDAIAPAPTPTTAEEAA